MPRWCDKIKERLEIEKDIEKGEKEKEKDRKTERKCATVNSSPRSTSAPRIYEELPLCFSTSTHSAVDGQHQSLRS